MLEFYSMIYIQNYHNYIFRAYTAFPDLCDDIVYYIVCLTVVRKITSAE